MLISLPVHFMDKTITCKIMMNHREKAVIVGAKKLNPLVIPLADLEIEEYDRTYFCDHMDMILLVHLQIKDGELVFNKGD